MIKTLNPNPSLIVRFAISFIFIVFGVWELLNPAYWVVFIPEPVSAVFNPLFATRVHGIVLIVLGVLLIVRIRRQIVALISTLVMLGVVVSVFAYSGFSDILVRDIVILLCVSSLLFERE